MSFVEDVMLFYDDGLIFRDGVVQELDFGLEGGDPELGLGDDLLLLVDAGEILGERE